MKFRKKPVVIEAHRWDGDAQALIKWAQSVSDGKGTSLCCYADDGGPMQAEAHTLEGVMRISMGDWVICGVLGEFYSCKPDIFKMTYEPAEPPEDSEYLPWDLAAHYAEEPHD